MKCLLRVLVFIVMPCIVSAQADTINFTSHALQIHQLKTGTRQYLVYFQHPAQNKTLRFSLWQRSIDTIRFNNQPLFRIVQQWYGTDSAQFRSVYSLSSRTDFKPAFHEETLNGKTKAYNWYADHITGADSITANTAAAFNLPLEYPTLNWNLDIETFEMLPLAEGKTFVIPFYDAGLTPPAFITYKVTGSEKLNTREGVTDCWKLLTEGVHNNSRYTQTFWISKQEHELLKEEDQFNGGYRYKIKIPAFSPDITARFAAQTP
ncbi:DUF3108 domain-containing protein [Deminuibacter soli]|nr:hypothetical protein [Deminuibacter soli]